jgi:hypothetical protein
MSAAAAGSDFAMSKAAEPTQIALSLSPAGSDQHLDAHLQPAIRLE